MPSPVDTVAIITGASRGLGQSLALNLLGHTTQLFTLARSHNPVLASEAEHHGYPLQQIQVDLANPQATEMAAHTLMEQLPTGATRYLLINNAGTVDPMAQANQLDTAHAITAAFNLNVTSVMLLTSAFLNRVKPLQADARIMNISSGAGRNPTPGWGVYCATKAALDLYTRVTDAEQHGVRIVSIAPGVVDTSMQSSIRDASPEHFPNVARFQSLHNQGQLASPDSVAQRLLNYLNDPSFGHTVIDDIRNYS